MVTIPSSSIPGHVYGVHMLMGTGCYADPAELLKLKDGQLPALNGDSL